MITNAGGQLAVDEIIGRSSLIGGMWRTLEGQCIYMNDLRRIGKTQILVKMQAEPPHGWVCRRRDLGGSHTADEFAARVYADSASALTGSPNVMRRMRDLLGAAAGAEFVGLLRLPNGSPPPWKEVLERTFSDVHDQMEATDQRILFLWDEVPFLIDNIAKRQGPEVAMEVLDVLRSLSQDYDRVRLLLTGSIGLHHVLRQLNQMGYSGSPLNRMRLVKPGPLEASDATHLAKSLLEGEELDCGDLDECAAAVATDVGNVPFYIHKLISCLPRKEPISPELIHDQLTAQVCMVENDWDLDHYRSRIGEYYKGDDTKLALAILDSVEVNRSIPFESIERVVAGQLSCDTESLRKLVDLLCRDHYIDRNTKGQYHFYLEVVRRWWQIKRDLAQGQS